MPGGITLRPLIRYWHVVKKDITEGNGAIPKGLKSKDYLEIGRYGYLFADAKSAERWIKTRIIQIGPGLVAIFIDSSRPKTKLAFYTKLFYFYIRQCFSLLKA